eukprot:16075708-Heterocapsa_arctica.AAC.1
MSPHRMLIISPVRSKQCHAMRTARLLPWAPRSKRAPASAKTMERDIGVARHGSSHFSQAVTSCHAPGR